MVKIKEENGKLIMYGFLEPNENVEFKFDGVIDVVGTFQNALDKLDRYSRTHEGWEHITWIGFHTLVPDEEKEECIKITEKYHEELNKEIKDYLRTKGYDVD